MTFAVPPTRGEAVTRQLRAEIISGVLRPGEIIKDAEVAARLNLSITPVREAIAQLVTEGLIEVSPNRTRRVAAVTRQGAVDLIDVLGVLSCAALERAVGRLTPDDLAAMRRALTRMLADLEREDAPAAIEAGIELVRVFLVAAGNRELETLWNLTMARVQRLMLLTAHSGLWDMWRTGLVELLDLLERGAADEALARYRRVFAEVDRALRDERLEDLIFDQVT